MESNNITNENTATQVIDYNRNNLNPTTDKEVNPELLAFGSVVALLVFGAVILKVRINNARKRYNITSK